MSANPKDCKGIQSKKNLEFAKMVKENRRLTRMAEFFLATMAKVSAMGLPACSPDTGFRSYRLSQRP
jgi:hypothetical protein